MTVVDADTWPLNYYVRTPSTEQVRRPVFSKTVLIIDHDQADGAADSG
jgi:hypothetical protein